MRRALHIQIYQTCTAHRNYFSTRGVCSCLESLFSCVFPFLSFLSFFLLVLFLRPSNPNLFVLHAAFSTASVASVSWWWQHNTTLICHRMLLVEALPRCEPPPPLVPKIMMRFRIGPKRKNTKLKGGSENSYKFWRDRRILFCWVHRWTFSAKFHNNGERTPNYLTRILTPHIILQ